MEFTIEDQAARDAITAARAKALAGGSWGSFYAAVLDAISDVTILPGDGGVFTAPKVGVDPAVWEWINGARKINSNTGAFASYVRDYTARQFELRTGAAPSS